MHYYGVDRAILIPPGFKANPFISAPPPDNGYLERMREGRNPVMFETHPSGRNIGDRLNGDWYKPDMEMPKYLADSTHRNMDDEVSTFARSQFYDSAPKFVPKAMTATVLEGTTLVSDGSLPLGPLKKLVPFHDSRWGWWRRGVPEAQTPTTTK